MSYPAASAPPHSQYRSEIVDTFESRVPKFSSQATGVFSRIHPTAPDTDTPLQQLKHPDTIATELRHAEQRLKEAKDQSTIRKILSLLPVALTTAVIVTPILIPGVEPETAAACAFGGKIASVYIIGLISDWWSGTTQAEDLGTQYDVIGDGNTYAPIMCVPFAPLASVYRSFYRISNLESHVESLQSQELDHKQQLTSYFEQYSSDILAKLCGDLTNKEADLKGLCEFHSQFEKEKSQV